MKNTDSGLYISWSKIKVAAKLHGAKCCVAYVPLSISQVSNDLAYVTTITTAIIIIEPQYTNVNTPQRNICITVLHSILC